MATKLHKKCLNYWPSLCGHGKRLRSTIAAGTKGTSSQNSDDYLQAKPFSEIPGPKGLPFLGTLLDYKLGKLSIERFQDVLLSRYRQYGPIFKETIAGETIIHLFDPEFIKVVYLNEGKIPYIPPLMETTQLYRQLRSLSPGLGNTNGEEWYRLRSAVQQMMMRPKAVTMYLPGVNEVIEDFISHIKSQMDSKSRQVSQLTHEFLKWQLESSGYTCFETRLGCFDSARSTFSQQMLDSNSKVFSLSLKLKFAFPLYKLIATPTWKQLVAAEDVFFGNGQKLVDSTVEKINSLVKAGKLQEGQYGFLTYLLGKPELTYNDISILTLSLFGDGLSTTVPSLIGQLYCIASNRDKQDKLYSEISSVVSSPEQPITADMINKMTYLKACVKEGFRFFPVGTNVARIPQKNIVIGGYQVPAGTVVELNNNILLQLPEFFENPTSYQPERWVRGEAEQNIHPYLLIPFGHGPRMCAGRRFAEQEIYVMICKLLQHFHLEWPHKQPMQQRYNILLTPDMPADFRFLPR